MNPWALLVIGIGLLLIIIGVKGTQHNVISAITGKSSTASTTSSASQSSGSAPVTVTPPSGGGAVLA